MKRFVTLFLSLSAVFACSTWSNSARAEGGWYVGFALPYNSVGGDFKGDKKYSYPNSSEAILVPKISSGFGWEIYGGMHAAPNLDWELSYLQTNHDGTFVSRYPKKAVSYSMFNIDLKYFVKTEGTPVFIQAGYGSRDITVKDGAVTTSPSSTSPLGDASYIGNGFNFGVGMTHPLNENIVISASALYRTASFKKADGTAGLGQLPNTLDSGGVGLVVGIAYDIRQ